MNTKQDIKIVRLAQGDVRFRTDHLDDLRNLIFQSEPMYPGIEKWYNQKVIPGIRSDERAAFVGYLDDRPVVSAIAKKGADAKICHLKIASELQKTNLGEVFFSLLGIELRKSASAVHLTLPESLWETKHAFFESFGFQSVELNSCQYRWFDSELRSAVSYSALWRSILAKMPKLADIYSLGGFSLDSELLFSIQPQYSRKILGGDKRVELRRKFSERWAGSRVNIYETAPTMGLVGEATIQNVVCAPVEEIWEKYSDQIGCTREQFESYATGVDVLYAIELGDVKAYRGTFSIMWASDLLNEELRPPQSYLTLERNKPWAQAVSLAAYMHGCFGGVSGRIQSTMGKSPERNSLDMEPFRQNSNQMWLSI